MLSVHANTFASIKAEVSRCNDLHSKRDGAPQVDLRQRHVLRGVRQRDEQLEIRPKTFHFLVVRHLNHDVTPALNAIQGMSPLANQGSHLE